MLWRKCKSVLRVNSRCNADVLDAIAEDPSRRGNEAYYYLRALCEAHLGVVNRLIEAYRLATFEFFPFEVSPWDVPVWYVHHKDRGSARVVLLDYARWDEKPVIGHVSGPVNPFAFLAPSELQSAMAFEPTPGELELMDALNLMERGDYGGAVRRVTTALEVVVEHVLREQLASRYDEEDVARRLDASKNDFPGRVRQYVKLSGRELPEAHADSIERIRDLRHAIVHRGERVRFADRGRAQYAVDTGRWAFNWFEDDEQRRNVREGRIGQRSLGRHVSVFDAELTPEGVVVRP